MAEENTTNITCETFVAGDQPIEQHQTVHKTVHKTVKVVHLSIQNALIAPQLALQGETPISIGPSTSQQGRLENLTLEEISDLLQQNFAVINSMGLKYNEETFPQDINPQITNIDNFYEGQLAKNKEYSPTSRQTNRDVAWSQKVSFEQLREIIYSGKYSILVGGPGSGKTTLSKKLAQSDAKLVMHQRCLEMYCDEKITLKQMIVDNAYPHLGKKARDKVFKWIKRNPSKCVFIFDGYDQVTWSLDNVKPINAAVHTRLSVEQIIANLCGKKFLPGASIALTSRPHSIIFLQEELRPENLFYLIDFQFEDMRKIFFAFAGGEAQRIWNTFDRQAPMLLDLCLIPIMLQLTLLAALGSDDVTELRTTTQVFTVLLKNLRHSEYARAGDIESMYSTLGELAYNATKNSTVVMTHQQIKEKGLSDKDVQDLIISVPGLERFNQKLFEGEQKLIFHHQTLQEYLCALYISQNMSLDEFSPIVKKLVSDPHWAMVRKFGCGLLLGSTFTVPGPSIQSTQQPTDQQIATDRNKPEKSLLNQQSKSTAAQSTSNYRCSDQGSESSNPRSELGQDTSVHPTARQETQHLTNQKIAADRNKPEKSLLNQQSKSTAAQCTSTYRRSDQESSYPRSELGQDASIQPTAIQATQQSTDQQIATDRNKPEKSQLNQQSKSTAAQFPSNHRRFGQGSESSNPRSELGQDTSVQPTARQETQQPTDQQVANQQPSTSATQPSQSDVDQTLTDNSQNQQNKIKAEMFYEHFLEEFKRNPKSIVEMIVDLQECNEAVLQSFAKHFPVEADFHNQPIGTSSCHALGRMLQHVDKPIELLRLWKCDLTSQGLKHICEAIGKMPLKIKLLDLSESRIVDEGAFELSRVLPNIEGLDLVSCNLTSQGLKHICKGIGKMTHKIKLLVLSYNLIDDEVALELSRVLPNIEGLDLFKCNLTSQGLKHICKAIGKITHKIKRLNLSLNRIDDEVALELSRVLPNIEELNLYNCNLTSQGLKHICKAIGKMTHKIEILDLRSNVIGDEGALELSRVLPNIERSWFFGCEITWKGKEVIRSKLRELGLDIDSVRF